MKVVGGASHTPCTTTNTHTYATTQAGSESHNMHT